MATGTTPPSPHPLKNIGIGVATTVLASAIVYFLGFHNDHADDEEVRVRKEATVEAWNSLMFYEKQFRETGTRMACIGDTADFGKLILNEYDKIIQNIGNIEKVEHVDNRLLSLIDRRLETLKDKKNATADYYSAYSNYLATGATDEDSKVIDLYKGFISKIATLDNQDTSFVNGVSSELKKKYKIDFNPPGPFIVTSEIVIGTWTVDRNKTLILNKDNTFSFTAESKTYHGKWMLEGLTIQFNFDDGSSIGYTINSGNQKFMMATDTQNHLHFLCR
ncbi:MAG TPA: hypothetical protein VET23_11075 [Chitinophagaceae bacterium]|nr:hypothetical protein [Chitinophagaceae bacterium]